jgi:hypothetical protein
MIPPAAKPRDRARSGLTLDVGKTLADRHDFDSDVKQPSTGTDQRWRPPVRGTDYEPCVLASLLHVRAAGLQMRPSLSHSHNDIQIERRKVPSHQTLLFVQ